MAGHHRKSSDRLPPPPNGGAAELPTGERHATVLRVAVLIRGRTRQLCLVRSISRDGLTVRIFSNVEPGESVAIELRPDRRLAGRIEWIRGGNASVRFDRPARINEIPAPRAPKPVGHASSSRLAVDRLAMIRAGSDISFASTRDISRGGICVVCERPLDRGTPVVLTLEGFRPLEGVVRWNRDGLCGISFNRMIPPAELGRWLAS